MLTYKSDPNNKPSLRTKEKPARQSSPLAKTRMSNSISNQYTDEEGKTGENSSCTHFRAPHLHSICSSSLATPRSPSAHKSVDYEYGIANIPAESRSVTPRDTPPRHATSTPKTYLSKTLPYQPIAVSIGGSGGDAYTRSPQDSFAFSDSSLFSKVSKHFIESNPFTSPICTCT